MDYDLEIKGIEWPGYLPGQSHSLPLEVMAVGPTDVSEFSLKYIQETIREHEAEFVAFLTKLDGGIPFKNVIMEVDTYDPNDIVEGPTFPPSSLPTKAPEPVQVMDTLVLGSEEEVKEGGVPWWVWLIIVIVILGLCCCGVWSCMQRNKDSDEDDDVKKQTMNIYMQNGGGQSVAGTRAGRSTATGMKSHRTRSGASRVTSRSRRTKTRLPKEQEIESRISEEGDDFMNGLSTAVSALPANEGFDPPEEKNMVVLYNPQQETQIAPRDPTMYINDEPHTSSGSKIEEPDGIKVTRKKSMFAAEAVQNERSRRNASSRRGSFGDRLNGRNLSIMRVMTRVSLTPTLIGVIPRL